jgi:hypothetical protein
MITTIIGYFLLFLAFMISLYFLQRYLKDKRNQTAITLFSTYIATFEFIADRCYNIIYNDELLVYSIEGMKIKDDEFDAVIKKFIDLFFKYAGTTLLNEFIFIFGSKDTLVFMLAEHFHSKYENDEIYKQTLKETMSLDSK